MNFGTFTFWAWEKPMTAELNVNVGLLAGNKCKTLVNLCDYNLWLCNPGGKLSSFFFGT